MRAGPEPIHAALILAVVLTAACPAQARPRIAPPPSGRFHPRGASDMDRTLARMAADARRAWPDWQQPRSPASVLGPATRERVAAPPFTGWGYGGTIPGAGPGF